MATKRKRQAHYAARIGKKICEEIALGNPIKKALEIVGPLAPTMTTFWRWLEDHPEFRERYERARQMQADVHADRILEMATDVVNNPAKSAAYRVASDILRWQAEIRDPRKFGPKVQLESARKQLAPAELKAEIAALEAELGIAQAAVTQPPAEPSPAPISESAQPLPTVPEFALPKALQ